MGFIQHPMIGADCHAIMNAFNANRSETIDQNKPVVLACYDF